MKQKFKQTEIGMIPEDWEVKKNKELFDVERGLSYNGRGLSDEDRGLPMANLGTIKPGGGFLYNGLKYWAGDYKKRNIVHPGDILIANTDITQNCIILGCPSIIPKNLNSDNIIFTHHLFALRNIKKINKMFLYYYLCSHKNRKMSKGFSTGTTVLALSQDDFLNFFMTPYPSISEQQEIAKLLLNLDSKIELNQQTSKIIEAIGQAIFKKGVVDGKREGWEIKPLDEIADFLNGLALQKYPAGENEEFLPVIKIKELRNGITEQTDKASLDVPNEYVVEEGDILFSWSGSLEVVIWTDGKGALNQHLFKITSQNYPKWFYYYWTKQFLPMFRHIAKGKATTMGHIQKHNLSESEALIPGKKTLNDMDKIMGPLIERYILLRLESKRLSKIRDSLLPKLMSGEIRVPLEIKNEGRAK